MFFLKHSYLYCPVCDTFSTCYDNTNTLYMIETAVNLYTTSVWLDIFSRRLFQQHSGMWSEVWGMADIRNLLHRLTMLHLNNNISWKRNSLLNNCYLVMLTNVSNTVFWVLNTLSLQISADPVSKFPDVTHWHGTGIKQAHAQDHNNEQIPKYRHPHVYSNKVSRGCSSIRGVQFTFKLNPDELLQEFNAY